MSAKRAHGDKSWGIYYLHRPAYKKANHTSMALLVNLLFTWKRKENRRGGHRCISMILIKGPICKKNR
jgi:hypothetical protein